MHEKQGKSSDVHCVHNILLGSSHICIWRITHSRFLSRVWVLLRDGMKISKLQNCTKRRQDAISAKVLRVWLQKRRKLTTTSRHSDLLQSVVAIVLNRRIFICTTVTHSCVRCSSLACLSSLRFTEPSTTLNSRLVRLSSDLFALRCGLPSKCRCL